LAFFLLLLESQPTPNFLVSDSSTLDYSWLFIKVMAAMVLVCVGAVLVIKYVLPRSHFVRRAQDSQIEIVERFTLEPKKNLYILKVAEKLVLIGSTETSLSSLLELGETEPKHDASETHSK
jgi:flagellar biogenesis protein FliO